MLYLDLIKNIFKKFHIKNENTIYLICDKRPLKNIKFETFKSLLSRDLYILCGEKVKIHINVINSHEDANIQIADWIAGAISRFLEKGHLWKEIGRIFNLKIDN